MPPIATDPNDLKLILNPARRKAFTLLIGSLVSQMRKNLEYTFDPSSSSPSAPLFTFPNSARDRSPSPPNYENQLEEARQERLERRLENSLSTPKMEALKKDALRYFDKWANEIRVELRKITDAVDGRDAAQRREEWLANRNPPPPAYTASPGVYKTVEQEAAALSAEAREVEKAKSVSMLQSLYPPISTRFTTISVEDRAAVLSCMVLILLSLGHYSAHSRTLLCFLTSSFALPMTVLTTEETEISRTLLLASKALTADAETLKRAQENQVSRRWKVGLASVAGAALIGVTGGLAAPVVAGAIGGLMGGVGLGGVASFLGIFAMNGALMGTLFGAFGMKMTGEMVDQYAKEVQDFNFIPVAREWGEHTSHPEREEEARRLRVTIGINGWLEEKEDIVRPWRVLGRDSEVFALRFEMDALLTLGHSMKDMVSSYAWSYVKLEILKRTVLATLWSALWPAYLIKMATSLDTPFAVAKNRSEKAGEVLADALINKAQGGRPVTLIGYSLGARVIYSCLKSLAARRAFGIVESVILIGSPIPSNSENWREMRAMVSGKLVNMYSENDYILAFLYRATSIQYGVAGLQGIKGVEGVSNEDLSKDISGHLRYPELVGKLLKRVGVEHVDVDDDIIEVEPEIKVIDNEDLIDFGENSADVEPSSKDLNGFRMVDDDSSWPASPTTSNSVVFELPGEPSNLGAMGGLTASMSDTSLLQTHSNSNKRAIRKPVASLSTTAAVNYDPLVNTAPTRAAISPSAPVVRPPPQTSTSAPPSGPPLFQRPMFPTLQHIDDDQYSSSGGGIVMEDNDDSMDMLECEPIPDDDYSPYQPVQRAQSTPHSQSSGGRRINPLGSGNIEGPGGNMFEEPKSLGRFSR